MCVYVCVCVCVLVCVELIDIDIDIDVDICMCMYVYVCMYVCIYKSVCVYTGGDVDGSTIGRAGHALGSQRFFYSFATCPRGRGRTQGRARSAGNRKERDTGRSLLDTIRCLLALVGVC